MSKGSRPRPPSVPMDVFDSNFDRIFGKKGTTPAWKDSPKPESSWHSATKSKVTSESDTVRVVDSPAPSQAANTSFTLTACAADGNADTASNKPD
jgi:hypothetical protein